jgi:monoamine oxidase
MARTPLLRAFERLADEHRAADREETSEYSRGEFLKRAGIGGAVFAVAPAVLPQRRPAATAPRIAIVGGGIAGLTAALTLADKGVASTIYEASTDRIGGRMHSDNSGYWKNGQVSEFCGELIDTGHKKIRHLANRFNLPVVDLLAAQPSGTEDTYWFFGSEYPRDQALADFQPIHKTLNAQVKATGYPTLYNSFTPAGQQFDQMSVYDWIETYVPGGHGSRMGALLDAAYNEEYGAETKDQASLNLMYLLKYQPTATSFEIFGASDERFHIDGGNQQLPEAIASHVGHQTINQGWAMKAIWVNADGTVSMNFSTPGKTKTVTADHVILCMSFAVLRTLDTSGANFDSLKKTAITQLGAGHNAKLQLQFDSRIWNAQGSTGGVYTDLGVQNAWDVTRGQAGATGILVDYSGGNVASGFSPSTPVLERGVESAGDDIREAAPQEARDRLPGDHEAVERKGVALDAFPRSAAQLLVLVLAGGPVHRVLRLRGRRARQHPLRRRALLDELPGLHGRRRRGRRAGRQGDHRSRLVVPSRRGPTS